MQVMYTVYSKWFSICYPLLKMDALAEDTRRALAKANGEQLRIRLRSGASAVLNEEEEMRKDVVRSRPPTGPGKLQQLPPSLMGSSSTTGSSGLPSTGSGMTADLSEAQHVQEAEARLAGWL